MEDISELIGSLNKPQRESVTAPPGSYMILAGAGSGKTRVLVHRIAWLVTVEHISPHSILAVTFTNKAAGEMRSRIENLLNIPMRNLWIGTFHGLAHRLLRRHWQDANLPQGFQILDSEDQYRLVRRTMRELGLDEQRWPPKQAQWFINKQKDEGLRAKFVPSDSNHHDNHYQETMVKIYHAYEETCQRSGLVDFAELLMRSHELWLQRPDILQHYQNRFKHILIDEFQDTNKIQYAWIRLLAGNNGTVFAVGDDDQSVYGWRGAQVENMQRMTKELDKVNTICLEQNYRSTATILNAANALIAHNPDRMGKNLWTEGNAGEAIALYNAYNEQDEASYIAGQINKWVEGGGSRDDNALLYRSNAQSRALEEALIHAGIPYKVYGGLRFFERAEIKDMIAYLRLVSNQDDDQAFERIVNTPTRGIGAKTIDHLRNYAREEQTSLWCSAINIITEKELSSRAHNALKSFIALIEEMKTAQNLPLVELTESVLESSRLKEHHAKEKGEKGIAKVENLQELLNATRVFEPEHEQELDTLQEFLAHAALEAGEKSSDDSDDFVHLMTLHSAKGLEFPQVFLCGMENGLFPHRISLRDEKQLEEERRLCYVGMTRAREKLSISYAESRFLYGKRELTSPSRFLSEIPDELIDEVRMQNSFSYSNNKQDGEFTLGALVAHQKFGEGVITNFEGSGKHARVEVDFGYNGKKWLIVSYANLVVISQ